VTDPAAAILALSDSGVPPSQIAAALSLRPGPVYSVLRVHRPDRPRSARRCTSEKRQQVLFLTTQGVRPGRVAVLLGVSRQYCYRILKKAAEP
jgi:hypothetical protein